MAVVQECRSVRIGLARGDFAGWIIDHDDEFTLACSSFVEEALQKSEHCLIISHPQTKDLVAHCLAGFDLDSGTVRHVTAGDALPGNLMRRVRAARDEALHAGAAGVRVLLDMRWACESPSAMQELLPLSTAFHRLLIEDGCLALLLYDSRMFTPLALIEMLTLHPRVVLKGEICDNVYFCPLEDPLRRDRHNALLDRLLTQVEGHKARKGSPLHTLDARGTIRMLEAMIDSTGYGMIVVDGNGKFILVNKIGESILGYGCLDLPLAERVRVFGNYLPDMVTPYPLEDLPVTKAVRGESVDQAEIFIRNERRPQGIFVSCTGRPIRDEDGRVIGGVTVFRDITEEKRAAEEQARLETRMFRTQKMESLGLLAGGIAHDFNNLLMGVLGNAGLALMELSQPLALKSRLESIRVSGTRLAELTNQLLAYAGKGTFSEEPVNLSDLVNEMHSLLRTVVSKKARVQCDLAADLPIIHGDATQLRQITMNLITNASEALGDQPGEIRIRTGTMLAEREYLDQTYLADNLERGAYVYLEVSDTGCGMSQETIAKIFDPFFTTKVKGRGLGLAAVLGLVRRHRGTLKVESEAGAGSSFRVLFPVNTGESVKVPAPLEIENSYRGHGTILIVDDEDIVRGIAKEMLERSGFTVYTASDGASGIELFTRLADQVSAVLLDMTMPDMSGAEVLQVLKRQRPAVKVIVSSGYSEGDTKRLFAEHAPDSFLQKPYMPAMLIQTVRTVLEQ